MDSTEELTISKLVRGLPRLKVNDDALSSYEARNPYTNSFQVLDKNTYLGIEVEVENIRRWDNDCPYWSITDDGSLRNNGREFISLPIRAWRVEQALTQLQKELNPDVDFSERTSVHIHMNVRTLTLAQLEAMILTYLVFERTLFRYVGHKRDESIFCVPIHSTTLGYNLYELIYDKQLSIDWFKYTALNLIPVMEKGTVEFRHMYGTLDKNVLMPWINMLLGLKVYALRNSPEYIKNRILELNTTSQFRMFGEEVFGIYIQHLWDEHFNSDVEQCITYIKNTCFINHFEDNIENEFEEGCPIEQLLAKKQVHKEELNQMSLERTLNRVVAMDPDSTFSTNLRLGSEQAIPTTWPFTTAGHPLTWTVRDEPEEDEPQEEEEQDRDEEHFDDDELQF